MSQKKIYIIRHAKSSWSLSTLNDFDRPLNDRGKKDAPEMAKRLLNRNVKINQFISSPALRAITTATYFAKEYNVTKDEIKIIPALYHAPALVFFSVIEELDDAIDSVAIFSHNPGITDFVNQLIPAGRIDNMPTTGIMAISAETTHWKEFERSNKSMLFFDYPKLV